MTDRDAAAVAMTPRPLVNSVVRWACGGTVDRLIRLTAGGLNETYRADLVSAGSVVVRIARRPVPWFTHEAEVMGQARAAGVPAPEVLGVDHVEHDGQLLSFSVQRLVPGRPLDEVARELPIADVERLVMDGGELLARVHSVQPGRGTCHALQPPEGCLVARVAGLVDRDFGADAAAVVERGAELLREHVTGRPTPNLSLAHGDWMPEHLLVDNGAIAGVIDWEFAGPASPAFDLGRWEVSVGGRPHFGSDLLLRGYARVADPESAAAGWVPAFAIDWALEVLAWQNPATPAYRRRCLDVIARYVRA